MYCVKCDEFFQPPPEEEKLMTTGGLPCLCPACEKKRWEAKAPPEDRVPVYPGMEYYGDGRELYRAARFSANNVEMVFVAVIPKPRKAIAHTLRKKRKHDINVFVMSERRSQLRTVPRTQILTNLSTYKQYNKPLKIVKVPDCWDPFTGVGTIEIKQDEIISIEKQDLLTRVNLKDGGYLALYYR